MAVNLSNEYFNTGYKYKKIEKNPSFALQNFQIAAIKGHAAAQYQTAKCYRDGIGTEKNSKAYHIWLKKAADQGVPAACYHLSCKYVQDENFEVAERYLKMAQAQNYKRVPKVTSTEFKRTQEELCELAKASLLIEDFKTALSYLIEAGDFVEAEFLLADLLEKQPALNPTLSAKEIFGRVGEKGHCASLFRFASLVFADNEASLADLKKALNGMNRIKRDAALTKEQQASAFYCLAHAYQKGIKGLLERQPRVAVRYLEEASNRNHREASVELLGHTKGFEKLKRLKIAAKQGDQTALRQMGIVYFEGKFEDLVSKYQPNPLPIKPHKGYNCLKRVDPALAEYKLGYFYYDKDHYDKAQEHFQLAMKAGNIDSLFFLAEIYRISSKKNFTVDQVIEWLNLYIEKTPPTRLKNLAWAHLGNLYYEKKEFNKAYTSFMQFRDEFDFTQDWKIKLKIAHMLENGEGVDEDPFKAFEIYKNLYEQYLEDITMDEGYLYELAIILSERLVYYYESTPIPGIPFEQAQKMAVSYIKLGTECKLELERIQANRKK